MEIYQTSLSVEDAGGKIFMCDTIIYKDEPWLVLSWLPAPTGEPKRPERIVRLGAFQHQKVSGDFPAQYMITYPIPKALVHGGQIPEELASDVIDHPEVSVLIGSS